MLSVQAPGETGSDAPGTIVGGISGTIVGAVGTLGTSIVALMNGASARAQAETAKAAKGPHITGRGTARSMPLHRAGRQRGHARDVGGCRGNDRVDLRTKDASLGAEQVNEQAARRAPGPRRLGSRSQPGPGQGFGEVSLGRYSWRLPQPLGGGVTLLLSSLFVLFELRAEEQPSGPLLYDGPMSTPRSVAASRQCLVERGHRSATHPCGPAARVLERLVSARTDRRVLLSRFADLRRARPDRHRRSNPSSANLEPMASSPHSGAAALKNRAAHSNAGSDSACTASRSRRPCVPWAAVTGALVYLSLLHRGVDHGASARSMAATATVRGRPV